MFLRPDQLNEFAARMRREGLAARADMLVTECSSHPGLLMEVGSGGLEAEKLPPDTVEVFFPLWEINDPANGELIAARRFQEILDRRQASFDYRRPALRRPLHPAV